MSPKSDLVPMKYKEMYAEYTDLCAENILRLQDIWEDCGIETSRLDARMQKLFGWFHERWNSIIEDELMEVEAKRERLRVALIELRDLSQQLEINLPDKPEGLQLQQQLEWADRAHATVLEVKACRLQKLEELVSAQKSLIEQMSDLKAFTLSSKEVPTEKDLQDFSSFIIMANNERRSRFEKLAPIIEEACFLMENMGKIPHLKIEEKMQAIPVEQWDLANANIQLAAETLGSLKVEEKQVHSRHAALAAQLTKLFDRLEIPNAERQEIVQDLDAKTHQSIRRLEELVEEYEELKRANMVRFVEKLKIEAKQCQDALRSGEPFVGIPGEATEETVDAYEKLITELKERHARLVPLFKLIEEKNSLVSMLHELEEAQKDPNRYKNRGGALLQETKKRERVNKNLPIIVKQIVKFLDAHEATHGALMIDGRNLREEMNAMDEKRNRHNSTTSTPLRNGRMTPSTPMTRPLSQVETRSTLKRAGTYTELKPKTSSLRTPLARAPNTVGKVYTRHMTMKSPGSTTKSKLSTAKSTLRRSTSYGDFETMLNSNDRNSTRILQPSNGRSTRMLSTRKLMF